MTSAGPRRANTEPTVLEEIRAYFAGTGDPAQVLAAFRRTPVHLCRQINPPAVITIDVPGQASWLQVFTSLATLTTVAGTDYPTMTLRGSEVLDLLLPLLPSDVIVVLDPHTEHMICFPPVPPIVPAPVEQAAR